MPRQIHVTVTDDQRQACWQIAQTREQPTTWQQVAREAIDEGLPKLKPTKSKGAKG